MVNSQFRTPEHVRGGRAVTTPASRASLARVSPYPVRRTPVSTPITHVNGRVSPYPSQNHSPPSVFTFSPTARATAARSSPSPQLLATPETLIVRLMLANGGDVSAPAANIPRTNRPLSLVLDDTAQEESEPAQGEPSRFQIVVRAIVKKTVGQRDTSGATLPDFLVTGNSFDEIVDKLWEQFNTRIRGLAVNTEEVWSVEAAAKSDWARFFQFKSKRHIQDNTRSTRAWHNWLTSVRGQTVTLLVYEYGVALGTAQDRHTFLQTCIQPLQTARSGATAEVQLRDVVTRLQERWGSIYQADGIVWRMWANHLTRNLDRSTLTTSISEPPPPYVANVLRPADAPVEQRLTGLQNSARLALDCIRGCRADYRQLRHDWEAFGRRIQSHESNLDAREAIVMAFLRDLRPPEHDQVIDLFARMENVEDHEHAE